MKQALFDTDTFSYIFDRRYPEVLKKSQQYVRVFRYYSISVITVTEILHGLRSRQKYQEAGEFLKRVENCEVLSIDVEEAVLAAEMLAVLTRSGKKIGALDPFIAATAIQAERPLVTNNMKHYQRIADLGFPLELENWRKP
jgi:tRNA(fMet)-specific endonuclease VapC